jgi:hypothetical protein
LKEGFEVETSLFLTAEGKIVKSFDYAQDRLHCTLFEDFFTAEDAEAKRHKGK